MTLPGGLTSPAFDALTDIAFDLRWTWSHGADALWRRIDLELWEQTHNPWVLLQELSSQRRGALAADAAFRKELARVVDARAGYIQGPSWFEARYGDKALRRVAYFSMEFGLGEALPLYAGGLGILAGDYLKTASDLGVPLIGVGLFYREGYFRQRLDARGWQNETFAPNDPAAMPIRPALDAQGHPRTIAIALPGRTLTVRVWCAQIGRAALYLLDTDHPLNTPADRGITARLYPADPETRLLQELVLGIGGWRVVAAVAPETEICHLNEGHAAFAIIERARTMREQLGLPFWDAFWAARAGNVFTTHTPVAAGFDRFPPTLISTYAQSLDGLVAELGISATELLALGRMNGADSAEAFNMAYLAMRGSARCIAVSRQHAEVSRHIFQPLFPRWPAVEVPIEPITNGVHVPTWDSAAADRVWTAACGKERWRCTGEDMAAQVAALDDAELWAMRSDARRVLIEEARIRLGRQWAASGLSTEIVHAADRALDPNILTLGFARRFTAYKRPNLLLEDEARLRRLLTNAAQPVQLLIAGKAHPADEYGKQLIQRWFTFAADPTLRHRLVFLEDYDIGLAQHLVQGVDLWINTPKRPWEACGTSGMKVLVNGGLNLSSFEGWWQEAYQPNRGWAIGCDADDSGAITDAEDAARLYALLEHEIVPEFYERDTHGLPRAWLLRMRRSMAQLTPAFSSNRMAQEHIDTVYLPAARAYRTRVDRRGEHASALQAWALHLQQCWAQLHLAEPTVTLAGSMWQVSVPVYLGEITPEEVRMTLYAERRDGHPPVSIEMIRGEPLVGSLNGYSYSAEVPEGRPVTDYTARLAPFRGDVAIPAELPLITWQR